MYINLYQPAPSIFNPNLENCRARARARIGIHTVRRWDARMPLGRVTPLRVLSLREFSLTSV